jgi:hypothetical protein
MERNRTSYQTCWTYRIGPANRFKPAFEQAINAGYVRVPVQPGAKTVNALYQTLRVVMAYLRDHGIDYYGRVRLKRCSDGIVITSRDQPRTLLVHDANGNNMWINGPPPIGGSPGKQ